MALFAKKKEGAGDLPVTQILSMKQQGYQNDQIIQGLQGQGYTSQKIFEAMNQADAGQAGAGPQQGMQQPPPGAGMQGEQFAEPAPQYEAAPPIDDKERIEEVAEAIIDEKWNDLLKDINKISESNNKMESRLVKLEEEIKNLKDNFDSLHRGVLGKISDYDRNLVNVGTEVKAMEKVFQKILPTFTDNVSRLARIAQDVKGNDQISKSIGKSAVKKK